MIGFFVPSVYTSEISKPVKSGVSPSRKVVLSGDLVISISKKIFSSGSSLLQEVKKGIDTDRSIRESKILICRASIIILFL